MILKPYYCSPRSQSASRVSPSSSLLHLIGGYSDLPADGGALHTLQSVSPWGQREEGVLELEDKTFPTLLASAVTLSSGEVFLTGGKTSPRTVCLLSGPKLTTLTRKAKMIYPRYGHASSRVVLEEQDLVIVAGGWASLGRAQDTAEIYRQNSWRPLQNMPTARVYFTLQVIIQFLQSLRN